MGIHVFMHHDLILWHVIFIEIGMTYDSFVFTSNAQFFTDLVENFWAFLVLEEIVGVIVSRFIGQNVSVNVHSFEPVTEFVDGAKDLAANFSSGV